MTQAGSGICGDNFDFTDGRSRRIDNGAGQFGGGCLGSGGNRGPQGETQNSAQQRAHQFTPHSSVLKTLSVYSSNEWIQRKFTNVRQSRSHNQSAFGKNAARPQMTGKM